MSEFDDNEQVVGGGLFDDPAPAKRRRPEATPKQRALGLLVRREHSRKELTRKLVAKGVSREDAGQAVEYMREHGWQDDARYVDMLLHNRAGQGYGPLHIRAELKLQGIDAELIAQHFEAFPDDWRQIARDLVRRRFGEQGPQDPASHRKAAELLARRGFDRDCIRAATEFDPDEV